MAMEYIQAARIESGHPYGLPPTSEVYKDVAKMTAKMYAKS